MGARTAGIAVWATLTLLAAAACGSGSSGGQPTPSPTPVVTPGPVTSDAVFDILNQSDVLKQVLACAGADQTACVEQIMHQAGASEAAIDFYGETESFLSRFQPLGPMALGSVLFPFRAGGNNQYVMLDGDPAFVYPEQELERGGDALGIQQDSAYPALATAFPPPPDFAGPVPNLLAFPADDLFESVSNPFDGGQRFIFQFNVVNVCEACATGYFARIAFDFDASGVYLGPTYLSLCRGRHAHSFVGGIAICPITAAPEPVPSLLATETPTPSPQPTETPTPSPQRTESPTATP